MPSHLHGRISCANARLPDSMNERCLACQVVVDRASSNAGEVAQHFDVGPEKLFSKSLIPELATTLYPSFASSLTTTIVKALKPGVQPGS